MEQEAVGTAGLGRLHVDVAWHGPTTAVVTPRGELDHHTAEVLAAPMGEAVEAGAVRLVVDCSGLEFCDSTGLNVLLGARLRVEERGGGVHLAAMRPTVARVFEITGAEAVFTVHETLAAALEE
jgi:anti-anti-sigma factor